jgi:cation/acetate symporter
MSNSVIFFLIFIALTLAITFWASKRSTGSAAFFAAGRRIMGWQNGLAIAGDFMSAASFLGVVGLISLFGIDGFVFATGGLVAFMAVLLVVAEPLRNAGKYTMADVLAYRHRGRSVTAMAAVSTLVISTFYMIAQMVGAGALMSLLLRDAGVSYRTAVVVVGILMTVYVVFGGMLATTWVQIVKAVLLMACTVVLTVLTLQHFHFSFASLLAAASHVSFHVKGQEVVRDFLLPGVRFKPPYGALELLSLSLVYLFGTAGLPHILSRFYTVPDAKTARSSVVWAMVLIGIFFVMTSILGFGAATILGPDYIVSHGGTNMSTPLLARMIAGDIFFALVTAVAFATILAVVAGLTISASTSFAHDFWFNVIHRGVERKRGETVLVARVAAFVVAGASIVVAILLGPTANVTVLATLAMAVGGSANFPAIVLSLFWRRFNTAGALSGLIVGLLASVGLILISPTVMTIDPPTVAANARHLIQAQPWFPLENPALVSIPLGFLAAFLGTWLSQDTSSAVKYNELLVRSNTGLGAEKAVAKTAGTTG